MIPAGFQIRPALPGDEAALYKVCLQTGDGGRDATHLYTDPEALGRIYVGPYLNLEPNLSFAAQDNAGICGYVLGASDSKRFYQAYVTEWLPPLRRDYPKPEGDPGTWSATEKIYHAYHEPEIFWPEPYVEFPAHLHIDLLARAHGRGLGRAMVELLLAELRAEGAPGVHLGMDERNENAERFYKALGFFELTRRADVIYLGKRL